MSATEPESAGPRSAAWYGDQAHRYWRRFLPSKYATLDDPNDYFQRVGLLLESWVESKAFEICGQDPPTPDALVQAHRFVLARGVFIDREPGIEAPPLSFDMEA
jgi:hypothetical protein